MDSKLKINIGSAEWIYAIDWRSAGVIVHNNGKQTIIPGEEPTRSQRVKNIHTANSLKTSAYLQRRI